MKTNEVVEAYVRGEEKGKASGGRLYIEGTKLFNSGTCLAERAYGVWYVNMTKYSRTTTTHQNRVLRGLAERGANTVVLEHVPMGTGTLSSLRLEV